MRARSCSSSRACPRAFMASMAHDILAGKPIEVDGLSGVAGAARQPGAACRRRRTGSSPRRWRRSSTASPRSEAEPRGRPGICYTCVSRIEAAAGQSRMALTPRKSSATSGIWCCARWAARASRSSRPPRCWWSAPAGSARRCSCIWPRPASARSASSTTIACRSTTCSARSCTTPPHVGAAKVESAKETIARLNPHVRVETHDERHRRRQRARHHRPLRHRRRRLRQLRHPLSRQRCLLPGQEAAGVRRRRPVRRLPHDLQAARDGRRTASPIPAIAASFPRRRRPARSPTAPRSACWARPSASSARCRRPRC